MSFNLYMSYSHTVVQGDNTFHYMRAGLFHGNGFTDLLLLSLDLDMVELLSLPSKVPATIAAGTTVQNLDGSSWVAPTDLYLLYIESMAFASIGGPLNLFLEQGLSKQSMCIYGEVPATESPEYPTGFSPLDKPPNVVEYPNWYVPSGISTKILDIAAKKSSFPFWTRGVFDFFSAYLPGDYNCEGLPYNIHVTCNPSEMDMWDPPTVYNDAGVWQVDGYYRDIESDQTTWMGFPLVYTPGTVSNLSGQAYVPPDNADPVIFFVSPDSPAGGVDVYTIMVPVLLSLGVFFAGVLKGVNELGGLRVWTGPSLGVPVETGYVIIDESDRVVIGDSDLLEVDFYGG